MHYVLHWWPTPARSPPRPSHKSTAGVAYTITTVIKPKSMPPSQKAYLGFTFVFPEVG